MDFESGRCRVRQQFVSTDLVDRLQLRGIGIVAAQDDLTGADLDRKVADCPWREDQGIEIDLLENSLIRMSEQRGRRTWPPCLTAIPMR
jgi:hypothetical protein